MNSEQATFLGVPGSAFSLPHLQSARNEPEKKKDAILVLKRPAPRLYRLRLFCVFEQRFLSTLYILLSALENLFSFCSLHG